MRFTIVKTSSWDNEESPYDEAFKLGKQWCINLDTIEDILRVVERSNHECVISSSAGGPQIEIYDDYRE